MSKKQVLANLDVVGELEGKSYLLSDLKDTIRIGGVLNMLSSSELESTVSKEDFGEDSEDAYGEITNIISGVCSSVFEDQYAKSIKFVKTDLQQVVPMQVDIESRDPIPNQTYYQSSMELSLSGTTYGRLSFLLPADFFQLEIVKDDGGSAVGDSNREQGNRGHSIDSSGVTSGDSYATKPADVWIVGDDDTEAENISAVLRGMGYSVMLLSFKDNVHNVLPGELKAVYLVMKDVNEQAFGAAIKISSSCSLPLIPAGPGWTRSKVIKVVKYGVRDILLTPASKEDIETNVCNHLLKIAA